MAAKPLSAKTVYINFATVEDLKTVYGVGDKIAGAIMDLRARMGNIDRDSFVKYMPMRVSSSLLCWFDFTPRAEQSSDEEEDESLDRPPRGLSRFFKKMGGRDQSTPGKPQPLPGLLKPEDLAPIPHSKTPASQTRRSGPLRPEAVEDVAFPTYLRSGFEGDPLPPYLGDPIRKNEFLSPISSCSDQYGASGFQTSIHQRQSTPATAVRHPRLSFETPNVYPAPGSRSTFSWDYPTHRAQTVKDAHRVSITPVCQQSLPPW